MKLRYKNMHLGLKPEGMPIYIPASAMKSRSLMAKAKKIWVTDTVELNDEDAIWFAKNDPYNWELASEESGDGLELDPDKGPPVKKRGRPAKAKVEAEAQGEVA